jgi:hypothetical protein
MSGAGAQSVHRAEKAYSVYQIADLLGSSPGEVIGWIEKGWLQCRRVGNEPIRVGLSQLLDFLQKRGIDMTNVLARSVNNAASAAKGAPTQPVVVEALPVDAAPRDSRQSGADPRGQLNFWVLRVIGRRHHDPRSPLPPQ